MQADLDELTVDLNSLILNGNVLDLGFQGKGIIYRVMKQGTLADNHDETAVSIDSQSVMGDCNWVYGQPTQLPFEDNGFDTVTSFFSIYLIKRKHMRNKTIKEIARTMKNNGRIFIWDTSINKFCMGMKKKIKVLLPGGQIENIEIKQTGYPGSFGMNCLIPIVERYFIIDKKRDFGGYFYIEAIKREDNR